MKLRGITGVLVSLEDYFKNAVDSFETDSDNFILEFKEYINSDSDYVAVSDSGEDIECLSESDEKQYETAYNNAVIMLIDRFGNR